MLKNRTFIILILLVTTLAYSNITHAGMFFDDVPSIEKNHFIKSLWPPSQSFQAIPDSPTHMRPIACFTLAINYAISGYDLWSYQLFNLAVHLITAAVAFLLTKRIFLTMMKGDEKTSSLMAFVTALLWACHPLTTECVTYINTRTESMAVMFLLLSLLFFGIAVEKKSKVYFVASCLAIALGSGCKEILITAPILILFYDRCFISKSFIIALKTRGLYYLASLNTWLIIYFLRLTDTSFIKEATGHGTGVLSFGDNLMTQCEFLIHYLKLVIAPRPLFISYTGWPVVHHFSESGVAISVIVSLLLLTAFLVFKNTKLGLALFSFFLLHAPTALLPIPLEMAAERRMYFPLLVVLVVLVYVITRWLLKHEWNIKMPKFIIGVTVLVVMSLAVTTFKRNKDYENEIVFWNSVVKYWPEQYYSRFALANACMKNRYLDEAIENFNILCISHPQTGRSRMHLGQSHLLRYIANQDEQDLQKAMESFNSTISMKSDLVESYNGRAYGYSLMNKHQEALKDYQRVLEIDNMNVTAHIHRVIELTLSGDKKQALIEYEKSLKLFNANNRLEFSARLQSECREFIAK